MVSEGIYVRYFVVRRLDLDGAFIHPSMKEWEDIDFGKFSGRSMDSYTLIKEFTSHAEAHQFLDMYNAF